MMCWNVWSMLSDEKCANVLQVLEDNDIQIACITETWFDSKNGKFTKYIKEAGYNLIHGFREDKRGGGTAILYRNTVNVKPGESSSSKYTSFEFSFLTLSTDRYKVILCCIYRKQEQSCTLFCDEFENFMDEVYDKGDAVMLMGDFNVWVDVQEDKDAVMLLNLMSTYGLTQLVDQPTHRSGHTLDHVYVNSFQIKVNYEVIDYPLGVTDHFPIIVNIPIVQQQQKEQTIAYRNMKNMDTENLISDFKKVFTDMNLSTDSDFKSNYTLYDSQTRTVVDNHAPVVTRTIKNNNDPLWMDAEFKENRATRRKMGKSWKKDRTDENRER